MRSADWGDPRSRTGNVQSWLRINRAQKRILRALT